MFTETLAQRLDDFDIEVVSENETSLTTETLSVTAESGETHTKVTASVKSEDGGWSGTFQLPNDESESEEALAQVIVDQVIYWSEV